MELTAAEVVAWRKMELIESLTKAKRVAFSIYCRTLLGGKPGPGMTVADLKNRYTGARYADITKLLPAHHDRLKVIEMETKLPILKNWDQNDALRMNLFFDEAGFLKSLAGASDEPPKWQDVVGCGGSIRIVFFV